MFVKRTPKLALRLYGRNGSRGFPIIIKATIKDDQMKKNEGASKKDLTPEEREAGWREVPGLEAAEWDMPKTTVLACGRCGHKPCKQCRRIVMKTHYYRYDRDSILDLFFY
jgi:hypothetical protein